MEILVLRLLTTCPKGLRSFIRAWQCRKRSERLKPGRGEEREPKSCHKTEKKAVTNVSNQWLGAKEQLKHKPSSEAGSEMLCFPLRLQRALVRAPPCC